MKKEQEAAQPQGSHLVNVNDFLQELCLLSLGAGDSRVWAESVSLAWSLSKFAEPGRGEGKSGTL